MTDFATVAARCGYVTYYPHAARHVGVKAAVLASCIIEWQRSAGDLGAELSVEKIESIAALTYEEQRAARRVLRAANVLVETARRLEHKTFYRIDIEAFALLAQGSVT